MSTLDSIGQLSVMVIGLVVSALLAVLLFGVVPEATALGIWAVLLILLAVAVGVVLFARIGQAMFPGYNVAEVEIKGPITQSGDSLSPLPGGDPASADEVVEQIEQADADPNVQALILDMNTPGGEVVASEDIRHAAEQFDGPTYAYATAVCASGGMWIASGCDQFHAREASIVGSIGVNGTSFGAQELLDKAGLEYRRFVSGEYKDTKSRYRDMSDDEAEYIQTLLDDQYEQFIETVAEGRNMDPQTARDTEARVYLGPDAQEIGLVDTVGHRPEMEENLRAELGVSELTIETFEPEQSVTDQLSLVSTRVAHAFGRGVASVFLDDGSFRGRL